MAYNHGGIFEKKILELQELESKTSESKPNDRTKISVNKNHYIEYYSNGKTKVSFGFWNNNLNGLAQSFYKCEQKKEEANYRNGKLNGTYKKFYRSGNLKTSAFYKEGVLDGLLINYKKDGSISKECRYKNGLLEGICKEYSSGKLKLETPYKGGVKDGLQKKLNSNGDILSTKVFKEGKRELRPGEVSTGKKIFTYTAITLAVAMLVTAIVLGAQSGGGTGNYYQTPDQTRALALNQCRRSLQGCCSHHQGIYSVSGNKIVCMDGTLSLHCSCN